MLKIKEINDKKIWEKVLTKREIEFYPLFQSWNWGEVQKKLGFQIVRLGLFDSEKLVGVCLVVFIRARRGNYLHLRHGPVFLEFNNRYFDYFIDYLKKLGREEKASFIRLSPLLKKSEIITGLFKGEGLRDSPMHNMDAEICWILDIKKSEDQILKDMRKTHRYLIRKGQTMNIKITRTTNMSKINTFINLYGLLAKRRGFIPHRGVKEEFEIFGKDNQAVLFLAEYQGSLISSALILFVGNTAIYHHGASDSNFRDIPASYLIQWEAILEAKRRGKEIYNFWGISPSAEKNHPWQGLTLFKTGFGGEKLEFLHAQDLPLTSLYVKTFLIDYVTKKIKGY